VLCSASVSALQIVFSNSLCESTAKWEISQIFARTDCWCTFNWNICNQNGHFIRCIQSSSFQGYDNIQIMGGHHQLRGIVVKSRTKWKSLPYVEEDCVCKSKKSCSKVDSRT
jgi:hypothetical protein